MLTEGSSVLIRECGSRKHVEDLQISDLIYDPLASKYVELVDILARKIKVGFQNCEDRNSLYPVMIKAGAIATGRPARDLLVSPSQVVFHTEKPKETGARTPTLRYSTASQLPGFMVGDSSTPPINEISYFALFTEHRQMIDVEGMLLSTFSADVYENDPQSSEFALRQPHSRSKTKAHKPKQKSDRVIHDT